MGASGSSEQTEEEREAEIGREVLDVLHQLSGDLGLEQELAMDDPGDAVVGQRARRMGGGGDNGRGDDNQVRMEDADEGVEPANEGVEPAGEGEEGESGESGEDGVDVQLQREATMRMISRLFGARP